MKTGNYEGAEYSYKETDNRWAVRFKEPQNVIRDAHLIDMMMAILTEIYGKHQLQELLPHPVDKTLVFNAVDGWIVFLPVKDDSGLITGFGVWEELEETSS